MPQKLEQKWQDISEKVYLHLPLEELLSVSLKLVINHISNDFLLIYAPLCLKENIMQELC